MWLSRCCLLRGRKVSTASWLCYTIVCHSGSHSSRDTGSAALNVSTPQSSCERITVCSKPLITSCYCASADPSTQVGACIVDAENHICGVGYNGFPTNCSDDDLPWARTADDPLDTKYPYVCHAELNAILNKNQASLKGCRVS